MLSKVEAHIPYMKWSDDVHTHGNDTKMDEEMDNWTDRKIDG
jgi:hypothetical protein